MDPIEVSLARAAREAEEDLQALEDAATMDEDEAILALARSSAPMGKTPEGGEGRGAAPVASEGSGRGSGRGRIFSIVAVAAAAAAAAAVLILSSPGGDGGDAPSGGGVGPPADLGPALGDELEIDLIEWTPESIVLDLWPDAGGAELEAGSLDVVVRVPGGPELARETGLFLPRYTVPLAGPLAGSLAGTDPDMIEVEVTLGLDGATIETHSATLRRP